MLFFWTLYSKYVRWFPQNHVFNIYNNTKMLLEHQTSLVWFLKDHVTLRTQILAAKNSALLHQIKNTF